MSNDWNDSYNGIESNDFQKLKDVLPKHVDIYIISLDSNEL